MQNSCSPSCYDVIIIGGGVVGCAMARRFALEGARVILVEKGDDILSGASKANSAILHTGFDAPPDSLELLCMQAGYAEYREIHQSMNLPLLETSAMVVAWNEQDEAKLDTIIDHAHTNGVNNVRRISRDEVLAREPHLAGTLRGAVLVPDEHVIDPWSAPLAYLQQAMAQGARVLCSTEVTGGQFDGERWRIETTTGSIKARQVINCAGLFGDHLEQRLLGNASFSIHPRKGQFVVFDKAAAALLKAIILPVPSEHTKGIVITRTIFGNLLVGPTAEEQQNRHHAELDDATLAGLIKAAVERIPALEGMPVTAAYAGLRPASERKEYHIHHIADRRWISVGGIRSTGLTSALGIARYVFEHYADAYTAVPIAETVLPIMPNLAEHRRRDWQEPGYDEIVCHCEQVTRREIEAAFASPLPPRNLGGLKRRTRACMGRCQGFYCSAQVAQLSDGQFTTPLATSLETGGAPDV